MDWHDIDKAVRVEPGKAAKLAKCDTVGAEIFPDREEAEESCANCADAINELQDRLWAERKRALLAQALSAWPERPAPRAASGEDALRVMARFGGFEIAMLAGAMLAAAEARMTLLIDGFIVTSALLVAAQISPAILDYCIYAHCSNEAGHRRQLDWLKGRPLLDLGLRLGEGTGAALALPLLKSACAFMNELPSFESAGVSEKTG